VDATQKIRALSSAGEATEELGDVTVRIAPDTKKKTLTISDRTPQNTINLKEQGQNSCCTPFLRDQSIYMLTSNPKYFFHKTA
jgi:hypothetical protein